MAISLHCPASRKLVDHSPAFSPHINREPLYAVGSFPVNASLSSLGVKDLPFSHFVYAALPLSAKHVSKSRLRRRISCCVCTLATVSEPVEAEEEQNFSSSQSKPEKRGPGMRHLILKPPLSDTKLADRFLESPQLQLKSFPVLSSCLPLQSFRKQDSEWMNEYLLEAKNALGYDLETIEPREDSPASHLDSLLFLAFNHPCTPLGKSKWVGIGHSRLCFLGQYVLELAFCELLLQMYPREGVGSIRERVFNLTSRKVLPYFLRQASLDRLLFPTEELEALKGHEKQMACRDVIWALVAATYLTLGLREVYRFLFEVLGMDLDAPTALPRERFNLPDIDLLSPDLETKLTWQDIVSYKASVAYHRHYLWVVESTL